MMGAVRVADLQALLEPFVCSPARLWHVGALDHPAPTKRSCLYASRGLFVSECPTEWAQIAKLGGRYWRVRRRDGGRGRFVDWLALTDELRDQVVATAVEDGLLEPTTLHQVSRWDDEWDQELLMTFDDYDDALLEAEDDETCVEAIPGYAAGEALLPIWRTFFRGDLPESASAVAIACETVIERIAGFDGIWWDEDLDVSRYSAPQGVIFQDRLDGWEWTLVHEYDPTVPWFLQNTDFLGEEAENDE